MPNDIQQCQDYIAGHRCSLTADIATSTIYALQPIDTIVIYVSYTRVDYLLCIIILFSF